MLQVAAPLTEVFSARELARAAGVSVRRVRDLIASGDIRTIDGEFVAPREAGRALRLLALGATAPVDANAGVEGDIPGYRGADRSLFARPPGERRAAGVPLVLSTAMHVALLASAVFVTTVGLRGTEPLDRAIAKTEPIRLVYLNLPGPGGGGGGGGLRQPKPPPRAQVKGKSRLSSPLPIRRPPPSVEPVQKPPEPKPAVLAHEPLPPIVAPIVTAPADARDRIGVLEKTTAQNDSRGPGTGGGAGSGSGTGLGEGQGSGVGPGSGGGTGGGPYRPGSGISPPRLLREVKPDYTEEARQRNVEGDVVLEIVVRSDGAVGEVRVLQSLGYGLDRRAVDAVRQWRFSPARRLGAAVDVMVEVAVEFKLR